MDDGSFDKKDVNLDEASLETPDMEESLETPEVGTTIEAEDTGSTEVAADTNVGDLPVEDIDPAVDTPAEEPVVKSNPFLDDAPKAEEPAAEEPAVETPAVEESAADAEPVETPIEAGGYSRSCLGGYSRGCDGSGSGNGSCGSCGCCD